MVRKSRILLAGGALLLAAVAGAHQSGTFKHLFEPSKESTLCQVVADSSRTIETQVDQDVKAGLRMIDGVIHVFYDTNRYNIPAEDKRKLKDNLRFFPSGSRFIVDGHADIRHSDAYNRELSRRRAQGVADIIKEVLPDAVVNIISHGRSISRPEGAGLALMGRDRYVRIFAGDESLNASRNLFSSDYYLVDASKKMGEQVNPLVGVTKWDVANLYPFPKNAQVFAYNSEWRVCGKNLADERPQGENNLYKILADFIDNRAKPNTSITVLVGTDTEIAKYSTFELFRIIDLAKKKGITVSFLSYGDIPDTAKPLNVFAKGTGGKFYDTPYFLRQTAEAAYIRNK